MPDTMAEVMNVVHRYMPRGFKPKIGIVLGSGLSSIAEEIRNPVSIPYQAIPGLQTGSVSGHASLLLMGYIEDVPVICLRGRLHLYEGVSHESLRLLIRIVKKAGANNILITGAVGSMQAEAIAGDIMMITDHINFQPTNPLVGPNDETIGPRFVSMEDAYDPNLREMMLAVSTRLNIPLHQGVYISVLGPSFETPAEIRAFMRWGADAVGMSIVPEVIIARHCGLKVICLAAIANAAAGLSDEKVTHEGTLYYGEQAAHKMTKLILGFVRDINRAMD